MYQTSPKHLEDFRQQLAAQQKDYQIIKADNKQLAEFAFIGSLSGQPVIWNARLSTLQSIACSLNKSRLQQFIYIQQTGNVFQVETGLYLKQVDPPAIKRTIIMIRNYKKLRLGRHEYGPEYSFTD